MTSSWAMQFLPPGISFCLYGCTSLVGSSILNVCIQGSEHLPVMVLGLLLALVGKVFLAFAMSFKAKAKASPGSEADTEEHAPEEQLTPASYSEARGTAAQQRLLCSRCDPGATETKPMQLSHSCAMTVCVCAGVVASFWSPLSTFA